MIESKSTSFSAIAVTGCWLVYWVGEQGRTSRGREGELRVAVVDIPLMVCQQGCRGSVGVSEASQRERRCGHECVNRDSLGAPRVPEGAQKRGCIPVVSMRRAGVTAGERWARLAGEWLKAPQRCLAAMVGPRGGRCDCGMRSSIWGAGGRLPVGCCAGRQMGARGGRGARRCCCGRRLWGGMLGCRGC